MSLDSTRFNWERGREHSRRLNGFTFIEIMIVVVIIGLLAGAVTLSTRHYLDKAKQSRARSDIMTLHAAMESYYGESGAYPTSEQGLTALVPHFIDKARSDPWGRAYIYRLPGRDSPYEILSYGADGREGGEGSDADLNSADVDKSETNK